MRLVFFGKVSYETPRRSGRSLMRNSSRFICLYQFRIFIL